MARFPFAAAESISLEDIVDLMMKRFIVLAVKVIGEKGSTAAGF